MILIAILALVGVGGWSAYQIFHRRSLRRNIHASLETMFWDVATVLNAKQVPFFLDYGTLLGYHREQRIFLHDFDVDLSISHTHIAVLQNALQWLPSEYYIKKPQHGDFTQWPGYSVKICHKIRPGNLDIYIYYPYRADSFCQGKACVFKAGEVVDCRPKEGFGEVKTSLVFPLRSAEINVKDTVIRCYIPTQTDAYLAHLYGKDLRPDMVGIWNNKFFVRKFW